MLLIQSNSPFVFDMVLHISTWSEQNLNLKVQKAKQNKVCCGLEIRQWEGESTHKQKSGYKGNTKGRGKGHLKM